MPPAAADDLTRLGGRLLTYRYAAPEQVFGEALGTATDVYALGVVLHELITGVSPYRRVREGQAPGLADFQQLDFARPSALVATSGVAGDLDAIVLKALRRDPSERYGTVEQFDEDLQRHLERRPVLARRGSRRYRAGRFIARHRLPLAAAAAVLVSLVLGVVVADRERREAVAAQARAERHFASVRELANTFIREIEEDLRGLAGTLPVREKLAKTSVKYLDSLSAETQLDPTLLAELAGGYRRVGEVFAGIGNGSLGEHDAAIGYLLKAEALFDDLHSRGIQSRQILDDQWRTHYTLAAIFFSVDDPRWEQQSLRGVETLRQLADNPEGTAYDRVLVAGLLIEHLLKQQQGQHAPLQSSPMFDEANKRLAAVAPQVGNDVRTKGNLAMTHLAIGELLMEAGAPVADLERALGNFQIATTLLTEVVKQAPDDIAYAAQLGMLKGQQAQALLDLNRAAEAESVIAEVLVQSARNLARDPDNVDMVLSHWLAVVLGTEAAYKSGNMPVAAERARETWKLGSTMSDELFGRIAESKVSRATADYYGGLALLASAPAQRPEACERLRAVEAALPEVRKELPDDAALQAKFGELTPALQRCATPALAAKS